MSEIQNAICEFIKDRLPTGSGINSDWWYKYKETGKVFNFFNDWQHITDDGYPDGYQSFCITIDKIDWQWRIKFVGSYRQHIVDTLREYLEDTMCHYLEDIQEQFITKMEERQ